MKKFALILFTCISLYASSQSTQANPSSFVSTITDADVKYLKAERKYRMQQYAECKALLNEYIADSKGKIDQNFAPYMYLGYCEYMNKNYDGAITHFIKDLEYNDTRCLYDIALTYVTKGDNAKAMEWLNKKQNSKAAYSPQELMLSEDWKSFANDPEFKKIVQEDKRTPFKKYCDSIDYYAARSDLNTALKMCDQAINAEPANPVGYHGKGVVLSMLKDFKGAVSEFEKENELEESSWFKGAKKMGGYQQLGQVYMDLKDFPNATKNTAAAIKGNKTFYMGYPDLTSLFIREKMYTDAKNAAADYVRIAEEDDLGYYLLALACSYSGDAECRKQNAQKAINLVKAGGSNPPKEYYDLLSD